MRPAIAFFKLMGIVLIIVAIAWHWPVWAAFLISLAGAGLFITMDSVKFDDDE